MNFETAEISPFELEIQITIENSSIQKKALKEVVKELGPQMKLYKKEMEALDKQQKKEWKGIDNEIDRQLNEALSQSTSKIPDIRKKLEWISRVVSQQSIKIAEKLPGQPVRPRSPGR